MAIDEMPADMDDLQALRAPSAHDRRRIGRQSWREDQRIAASTTLTIATTSPMIQDAEPLEPMIAAMATPIPMTPPVAISRTKIRSNGLRRRSRGGSMFFESAGALRGGAEAVAGLAAVEGSLDCGIFPI